MHLKQHYEPQMQIVNMKRKHHPRDEAECEPEENMMMHYREIPEIPEKLIGELDDSQEHIKHDIQREALPEIDEFNEFSEPEDMMENLRKEVEKVVETIEDNECIPESSWQNYQVPDEIEEPDEQAEEILYSKTLITNDNSMDSNYAEEMDNGEQHEIVEDHQQIFDDTVDTRNFDSDEDEEDDQPLEQVRQTLKKSAPSESEAKRSHTEDDKEDLELTECLKKIHNFKCTACNKAFNSRTALGYHLKTHTSERRYVCDQVSTKRVLSSVNLLNSWIHFSVAKSS